MELTDIDLNQLVLFQQLMVERRVSKVAENLGLTQPAVSNTLAKLRRQFGDELFVRSPAGMLPTPFAEQLAEPIGYALSMIHGGLNQHSRFEPASVKRSLTIAMTDIGEIVFLPALVERLRRDAPGISLSTVRTTATTLRDDMEAGKVDLAIGPLPQLKAGFFQRRLFRQRYVCLFRQGHPLDRRRLSLADFKAAEHLVIVSAGTGHGKVDELIRRAGVDRKVRLTVPHFRQRGSPAAPNRHGGDGHRAARRKPGGALRPGLSAPPGQPARGGDQRVLARQGAPLPGAPVAARAGVRIVRRGHGPGPGLGEGGHVGLIPAADQAPVRGAEACSVDHWRCRFDLCGRLRPGGPGQPFAKALQHHTCRIQRGSAQPRGLHADVAVHGGTAQSGASQPWSSSACSCSSLRMSSMSRRVVESLSPISVTIWL